MVFSIFAYMCNRYHSKSSLNYMNICPLDSDSKESACNVGYLGLISGSGKFPGGGHGSPLEYSFLENPMDRGAFPWGHKESDLTERLTHTHVPYQIYDLQII